ncbi:MAG: heparinase II/III family protein [Capsulimonadaceae bacterium]|nr:heparinase II/III family protein [Capsulimonadaceae bacterium]
MKRSSLFLHGLAVVALSIAAITLPAFAQDAQPLGALRPAHPRLLALDSDVAHAQEVLGTDTAAQTILAGMKAEGTQILSQPPVEYVLKGPRLLDKSRTALRRITLLAGLYRIDHDPRWLDRARQEIAAVDAFQDWHPQHFLDTAEMTAAVAIGYDWLYNALSPEERASIRQSIVEKGLKPGLDSYNGKGPSPWWPKVSHNWNLVCNGGMLLGALAVAEDEPDLAKAILTNVRASMPIALATYAPDGGWPEGPGYWEYATQYAVLGLAALQTALGTDWGFSDMPGLAQTGYYRIYMTGPTNKSFNFADAGSGVGTYTESMALSRRYRQPVFAWSALHGGHEHNPLALFWYEPASVSPADAHLPLNALFKQVNVATMRSSWDEPNALYVAFKGGDNKANHSHLDIGSFVLDALGERWVQLLGADNYDMPGYFGKERFTYYRLGTNGQNTLVINGQNQSTKAAAPIVKFQTTPLPFAEADLTQAYAPLASHVSRSVQLVGNGQGVVIQDEIEAPAPVSVRWQVHTAATVQINGATAVLSLHGKQLYARILQPLGAQFQALSAEQAPPQNENKGITKLLIDLPDMVTDAKISVILSTDPDLMASAAR